VQDLFDGKSLENTLRNQSLQYKIRAVLYNAGITTRLWKASCDAYRRGWHPVAWGIKLFNLLVFKAILPYECDIQDDLYLEHSGIGCAFAHFVTIGKRVTIGHHTAIASQNSRIIIEDDVKIGMHVIILGAASGGIRRIGRGATIGPGSIVMSDVAAGASILPMPSRVVRAAAPVAVEPEAEPTP